MKIAVSTADGKTICGHLGKCRSFIIFETDGVEIKGRALLNTGGACPGHGKEDHPHTHNISPFEGCRAVITQGMGGGMLQGLKAAGIKPVITELSDPETAVRQFLGGGISESAGASCVCGSH